MFYNLCFWASEIYNGSLILCPRFFYNNKLFLPKDNKLRPALFLDRDGVLIKEKHFISKPSDVELEDGMSDLIDLAKMLQLPIVIITNYSKPFCESN